MRTSKKLPGWLVVILDLLLCAAMLLTFAYFHHARMLLGIDAGDGEVIQNFDNVKKPENEDNADPGADGGDTADPGGETVIPAHLTHAWTLAETVAPTCTEGGYTQYICGDCGETKIDDRVPALGHRDFVVRNAKDPTDKSKGYTGDTYCGVCDAIVVQGGEIPSTDHDPDDLVLINVRESTCSVHGYTGDWYCRECREVVATGAQTALKEHKYKAVETVAADCTREGYTKMRCIECGDEIMTDQHPKTDHDFEVNKVITPDCRTEGYTVMKCSSCGLEAITDPLPKTDHTPDEHGYCTGCGRSMLDTSGDFGASFPYVFLQDDEAVTINGDEEVRAYAAANWLELSDVMEGTPTSFRYMSLYRSHDVFVTLREVNTDWYYEGTKKTYKVQYYVYDVYVRNIENIFTSNITSGSRVPIEELVAKGEAYSGGTVIAAVNGDYLGNKNHCLVAERNGELLRYVESVESDVCVLYFDGTVETYTPETYNWEEIAAKNPYQIWNFGPALLDDGGRAKTAFDPTSYDNNIIDSRHPRTALGYYEPGHYSFIVVDGRSDDSKGVRAVQLAELACDIGCVRAYNMDGGDSSQAYLLGEDVRVDQDRGEQRKLYDIICIGEVGKP